MAMNVMTRHFNIQGEFSKKSTNSNYLLGRSQTCAGELLEVYMDMIIRGELDTKKAASGLDVIENVWNLQE